MASFGASRNTLLSIAEGWIEDIEHGAREEDADPLQRHAEVRVSNQVVTRFNHDQDPGRSR